MRGRGWLSNFSVGNPGAGARRAAGERIHLGHGGAGHRPAGGSLTVAAAVTNGTASNPRVADDNSGKQFAARVTVDAGDRPGRSARHLRGGSSWAATSGTCSGRLPDGDQTTLSARTASTWSTRATSGWCVPKPCAANGGCRCRRRRGARAAARGGAGLRGALHLPPGFYAAGRAEHLGFNRIAGAAHVDEWDAPVTRIELGGGYYVQRNLVARPSLQLNRRDGGRVDAARSSWRPSSSTGSDVRQSRLRG